MSRHAVILAGGRGTRFWPRSRTRKAKQVLPFLGDKTLIQQTVARLEEIFPSDNVWILTNEHLRGEILRQLPRVPPRQVLAEPAQRNTAPCLGLAAQLLLERDPDAEMAVFPADQIITKEKRFLELVRAALRAAAKGKLVVLGIQPRWAETGYGYIEFPDGVRPGSLRALPVLKFREKPDRATAERYVDEGRFYWNSGMFFWRAGVLREALRRHLPRTATLLASLPPSTSRSYRQALAETFPLCENISIDYAVMEKADNVAGIAAGDIGWNDVGSWNAVYELSRRDQAGNAARTDALFEASTGNFVDAPGKLTALIGVRDLVIVDTPDALLVADRNQAQQVSGLVKMLERLKRDELL
jgi:mannose-1-phosphate guanylyltransferase